MSIFHKNRRFIFSALFIFSILIFSANSVFAQEDEEEEFTQGDVSAKVQNSPNEYIELFNKGQEAHANGDFRNALSFYDEAIKANPEFPEAEFQRGSIFQILGKPAEAERAFRRAIEIRRDWTLPMSELGGLLINKGEYVEAESLLDKAIRIDSMSFPAYVALTELKLKTNAPNADLKNILAKLQYLTTKTKIPASVWSARAAIERKLGDLNSAQKSIGRALSIDEKNQFALSESIELALIGSDFKGALKNAENLSRLYPNSISAKMLLSRSLYANGKSDEAVATLAAIKQPTQEVLLLKASLASINSNDDAQTLEKILETDDKNITALGRLCTILRTAQPQKALVYCQRASELEPNEMAHAIGFGAALVQVKRYADAVKLFRKLTAIAPENYTIRANLATALFQMENYVEAIKEYQWITEKQPDLPVAYYFLAISHDESEEYMDAMANYQQFLRLADDPLQLEIDKVNLRLPILQRLIKQGKGKKRR